jgi:hypothetical protein
LKLEELIPRSRDVQQKRKLRKTLRTRKAKSRRYNGSLSESPEDD